MLQQAHPQLSQSMAFGPGLFKIVRVSMQACCVHDNNTRQEPACTRKLRAVSDGAHAGTIRPSQQHGQHLLGCRQAAAAVMHAARLMCLNNASPHWDHRPQHPKPQHTLDSWHRARPTDQCHTGVAAGCTPADHLHVTSAVHTHPAFVVGNRHDAHQTRMGNAAPHYIVLTTASPSVSQGGGVELRRASNWKQ